jgi:hypothetical protein
VSRTVLDAALATARATYVTEDYLKRTAGQQLAARLNEAFRRHRGLTGYVHANNRRDDEVCMYDALEELGLLPKEPNA